MDNRGKSAVPGIVALVAITAVMSVMLGTFASALDNETLTFQQAGYHIEQQPDGTGGVQVNVVIVSLGNSEWVSVTSADGTVLAQPSDFTDSDGNGVDDDDVDYIGGRIRIAGLHEGDRVIIIAGTEKTEDVVGFYTVK